MIKVNILSNKSYQAKSQSTGCNKKRPLQPVKVLPKKKNSSNHERKKVKPLSHVQLFATPWTAAYQAPPSMGFSRREYWSGVPLPSPGDLPDPGMEPGSPALQADASPSEPPGKPPVSTASLFTVAKTQKQPECPSSEE